MDSHDVIILGGGLVGLTLAIALERHGLTAAVVDPLDPEKALAAGFDGRASAIASASWRMLDALGIAETLKPHGCAIHRIEVRDGLQKDALDFTTAEDDEPLGYMLENRTLRQALREAAVGATGVTLHMPDRAASVERNETGVHMTLASGRQIRGQLLLACEGRKSPTREAAGIRTAKWGYDHVAVISAFDHTKDHHNIAHEIFYSAGPFALLPLNPGTRSALVWTVSPKDA